MRVNEKHVYGIPGAGKTTFLSKEIKRLAEENDDDGSHILISSFTKAAARELVDRELPVPADNVGTLHALCYRLMGRGELAEKHIADFNKEYPAFALSKSSGVDMDNAAVDQKFGSDNDKLFNISQVLRAKLVPTHKWADVRVRTLFEAWTEWKSQNNYIDFTDMIDTVRLQEIPPPPGVTVGYFDEVQDFTPMQMGLIRMWADKYLDEIVLAGDDDQTIFSFTGATADTLIDTDLPPENRTLLEQSYRVPRLPQERAEAWVQKLSKRQPKRPVPRKEQGKIVDGFVTEMPFDLGQPDFVADYVEEILNNTPKKETVMLLTSCNYMLTEIIAELRFRGIPFGNRFRRSNGAWNPLHPGKGTSTARRLYEFLTPMGQDFYGVEFWTPKQLALWLEICAVKGVLKPKFKEELITFSKRSEFSHEEFMNLVMEAFVEGELDAVLERSPYWLYERLTKDKAKAMEFPRAILERCGKEALIDEPRVLVGTVHSVKGGQADHVILFPDISLNALESIRFTEGKDAIIRQFYVGMTRCRESLHIARPASNLHVPI